MCCKRKSKTEGVHRIAAFLAGTKALDWSNDTQGALDGLFNECTSLIQHEITYYFESRQRSKRLSFWFRLFALVFGTAGFLAPLVEAAGCEGLGVYGYLFLAVSAAFLTSNAIFGGTSGHARYVATQLRLEKLLSGMVIEWQRFRSGPEANSGQKLAYLSEKMQLAYEIIIGETDAWGKAIAEEVAKYESSIKQSAGDS